MQIIQNILLILIIYLKMGGGGGKQEETNNAYNPFFPWMEIPGNKHNSS